MSCFDDNVAVEFIEGSLPSPHARDVESHAAHCQSCRRLIAELARAITGSGSDDLADDGMMDTLPAGGDAHAVLNRGDKVNRFVILDRIGTGGMGVVFAAYDPRLDRKVALKLLRSREDSAATPREAQTRLLREAQAMAQLSHPYVISVYDVGTYRSEVYIAMEFVEGDTLSGWLRKWERPWRDVHAKFLQAAQALASAHAAGLVHRDFKPDNVLVGYDERVRVMDFGLARSLYESAPYGDGPFARPSTADDAQSALNQTLTKTGSLLGTPRYMAPEQFLGQPSDARSDQFSFCLSFYEALYGYHPFADGTAQKLAEGKTSSHRPPPEDSHVPTWLYKVLAKGLERAPDKRHASMDVLLQRCRQPVRRPGNGRWLVTAGILAAAVVLLGVYAWQKTKEADEAAADARRTHAAWVASLTSLDQVRSEKRKLESDVTELRRQLATSKRNTRQVAQLRQQLEIAEGKLKALEKIYGKRIALNPPPKPKPKPPQKGLRVAAIRKAISAHTGTIQVCFGEWKERKPTRATDLHVRFGVNPDGIVEWTQPRGQPDKVLRRCVTSAVTKTIFPTSNALTVVRYTFSVDTDPEATVQHSAVVEEARDPGK